MSKSTAKYARTREIAERTGVSERWLKRAVFEKRVPYYKVGRAVLFDVAEMDAWLAARRVEPIADRPYGGAA